MNTSNNIKNILKSIEILSPEDKILLVQQLQNKKENISSDNPWIKYAGMFKDDPQFDEFLGEMESYRQELDSEIKHNNETFSNDNFNRDFSQIPNLNLEDWTISTD
ncbi:MAG: hypothetical protein F6K08_25390 [Okeania sp. SIO1H6]|nr:hypothetical protein [Okeania sp. SIO1H6]